MIKSFVLLTVLMVCPLIEAECQNVSLIKGDEDYNAYGINPDSSTFVAPQKSEAKALKAIMDSKKYSKAETLVRSNISNLNNEDRAKAYNKLVDLAMVVFDGLGFDPGI